MNMTIEEQVARYSRALIAAMERDELEPPRAPSGGHHRAPVRSRGQRTLWVGLALFVVLVGLVALIAVTHGDSGDSDLAGSPARTDAASATEVLDRAVAMVAAGRSDALCSDLAADVMMCDQIYGDLDPDRVPATAPRVVSAVTLPEGEVVGPSTILTVCGLDGLGEPYVTDIEVLPPIRGRHLAVVPIYWSGIGIVVPDGPVTNGTQVMAVPPATAGPTSLPDGCPTGP